MRLISFLVSGLALLTAESFVRADDDQQSRDLLQQAVNYYQMGFPRFHGHLSLAR